MNKVFYRYTAVVTWLTWSSVGESDPMYQDTYVWERDDLISRSDAEHSARMKGMGNGHGDITVLSVGVERCVATPCDFKERP